MQKTTVVNVRFEEYDVYIGRGRNSKWGNPYSHKDGTLAQYKTETREESVEKYREYIYNRPELLAAIKTEIKGKRLGCWCKNPRSKKPIACHGDILAEIADSE